MTADEKHRRETVIKIQTYLSQGYSSKTICEMLHTTYRLKPQKIGTPCVESITGYIKRLAKAHLVSVGNLLSKEIIPNIEKDYLCVKQDIFIGKKANRLNNSNNNLSQEIVRILSEKTLVSNLNCLNTSLWKDVLNSMNMFREYQAWCPICYEESLELGNPIYEQLIWNFRDVEICGKHQVRLVVRCPYCKEKISILSSLSRVGFCNKCKSWLGLKNYSNGKIPHSNIEWDNWVYDNVGELLALAPTLEHLNCLNLSKNVSNLISINHTSLRGLENNINVTHNSASNWIKGIKPLLKDVLKLSFKLDESLINIFTKEIFLFNNVPNDERIILTPKSVNNKIDIDKVKKVIDDAISSNKGLSLNKISNLTGVSTSTIKRHFPNDVDKLRTGYNEFLEKSKVDKLNLIKNTMKSLYQRGIYPSMKSLKRELGKRVIINDEERNVWIATLNELGCTREVHDG